MNYSRVFILKPLIAIILVFSFSQSSFSADIDLFKEGVAEFKQGNYERAIGKFKQANMQGIDTASLHYNLAVSYYKMGQYLQARKHFKQSSTKTAFEALSYYNLGLIAFRLDGKDKALVWFNKSKEMAADPQVRRLSEKQIRTIETNKTQPQWQDSLSGFASMTHSNNDNVNHGSDDLSTALNKSDSYYDIFSILNYRLTGNRKQGSVIKAGLGMTRYNTLSIYDDQRFNLGFYYTQPLGDWKSRYGAQYYHDSLDGNGFQQRIKVQARFENKYMSNQRLRLQYEYFWIDSLDLVYNYLAGSRQRVRIENSSQTDFGRLRMAYVLEINDREDLTVGRSFVSSSPIRHTLLSSVKYQVTADWATQLDVSYRKSNYNKANITAGTSLGVRDENRFRATLKVSYDFSKRLSAHASYRHTNNRSNYLGNSYSADIVSFSLNKYF